MEKKVKVVAFVGMPGAGKSLCAEYTEKKGYPLVYFGGITIKELKARNLAINEANEKMVREDIRAKEGKGAFAKRIVYEIKKIAANGHEKVVADGLYSWSEYKIFKESFGEHAIIIALVAPRHVRHERLTTRPVRPLTEEEVNSRDYAEIENIEKGGPIANADYTLLNDGSKEKVLGDLDKLLKQIDF